MKKDADVVNRLNKTKKELYPDLAAERQAYDRRVSLARKSELQERRNADKSAKAEALRQADLKSYKHLMQVRKLGRARAGSPGCTRRQGVRRADSCSAADVLCNLLEATAGAPHLDRRAAVYRRTAW